MKSSSANFNSFDTDSFEPKQRSLAPVVLFRPAREFAQPQALLSADNGLVLSDLRRTPKDKDRKLIDFLLLGAMSIFIHTTLVENFDRSSFDAELIEPEKPVNKVEISIIQPKPVAPPPKARPKPIVKKAVPLKKPKEKPKSKPEPVFEEPSPLAEPVLDAPYEPTPAPVEKITRPRAGANYRNNPPPVYPDIAMDRGWQGKVLLKVYVKANGKPKTVSVLRTSGKKVLDAEAVRTVKKWTFEPARRGTTPIDGWVTIPINFSLR